ncbi:MAG: TetR/AcrR family transcriptional regulator [Candidatus Binataceae bacterium]
MASLQEERSAETRRKLLDATLECLSRYGYAGTTTTEIARRAGVSRGAQLHHFPHKKELVVSALEHVFELRLAQFRQVVAEMPASVEAKVDTLIEMLWLGFKGPTFYAWLELVMASRTDTDLRKAIGCISKDFGEGIHRVFEIIFGPAFDANLLEFAIFGLLEAMAIERVLFASPQEEDERIGCALDALKSIARSLVGRDRDGAATR